MRSFVAGFNRVRNTSIIGRTQALARAAILGGLAFTAVSLDVTLAQQPVFEVLDATDVKPTTLDNWMVFQLDKFFEEDASGSVVDPYSGKRYKNKVVEIRIHGEDGGPVSFDTKTLIESGYYKSGNTIYKKSSNEKTAAANPATDIEKAMIAYKVTSLGPDEFQSRRSLLDNVVLDRNIDLTTLFDNSGNNGDLSELLDNDLQIILDLQRAQNQGSLNLNYELLKKAFEQSGKNTLVIDGVTYTYNPETGEITSDLGWKFTSNGSFDPNGNAGTFTINIRSNENTAPNTGSSFDAWIAQILSDGNDGSTIDITSILNTPTPGHRDLQDWRVDPEWRFNQKKSSTPRPRSISLNLSISGKDQAEVLSNLLIQLDSQLNSFSEDKKEVMKLKLAFMDRFVNQIMYYKLDESDIETPNYKKIKSADAKYSIRVDDTKNPYIHLVKVEIPGNWDNNDVWILTRRVQDADGNFSLRLLNKQEHEQAIAYAQVKWEEAGKDKDSGWYKFLKEAANRKVATREGDVFTARYDAEDYADAKTVADEVKASFSGLSGALARVNSQTVGGFKININGSQTGSGTDGYAFGDIFADGDSSGLQSLLSELNISFADNGSGLSSDNDMNALIRAILDGSMSSSFESTSAPRSETIKIKLSDGSERSLSPEAQNLLIRLYLKDSGKSLEDYRDNQGALANDFKIWLESSLSDKSPLSASDKEALLRILIQGSTAPGSTPSTQATGSQPSASAQVETSGKDYYVKKIGDEYVVFIQEWTDKGFGRQSKIVGKIFLSDVDGFNESMLIDLGNGKFKLNSELEALLIGELSISETVTESESKEESEVIVQSAEEIIQLAMAELGQIRIDSPINAIYEKSDGSSQLLNLNFTDEEVYMSDLDPFLKSKGIGYELVDPSTGKVVHQHKVNRTN